MNGIDVQAAMDLAWRAQRRQQKHDMGTSDINQSRQGSAWVTHVYMLAHSR